MKLLAKQFSLAVLSLIIFASCEKEKNDMTQDTHEEEKTTNVTLAKIDLGEDGTIEFIEVDGEDIIIDATVDLSIHLPEDQTLSASEFYSEVSGKAAPKELIDAERRINALETTTNDDGEEGESSFDDDQLDQARITASEFQDEYCRDNNTTFSYCWVNRTNTSYVKRYAYIFYSGVYPYRGNVTQRIKKGSKTLVSKTVLEGKVSYIRKATGTFSFKRKFESRVYNASGDGYHHSCYGF